ncbi:MAG: uroporphyrinogen-III synthase [Erythrobacter sp.]
MTPLFLFRPEPGWHGTARAARAMGLTVRGAPLFTIEPVAWDVPGPQDYDGLLVGSANVLRHGGEGLEGLHGLPVLAVGEATADAARAAGFAVTLTGRGGLQPLLDDLAGCEMRLLRLAGEERVALIAPQGIAIETRVVYRAVARALPADEVQPLAAGGVVALHSAAAARHFAAECARLGIERSSIALAVIGPHVAEAAGQGWHSIHIAIAPDDSEVLALATALCQTPRMGKQAPHGGLHGSQNGHR